MANKVRVYGKAQNRTALGIVHAYMVMYPQATLEDLRRAAKFVLHDLAQLMKKHPELRLKLVGHTSSEGDSVFNKKLSEERAQSAVDFLVGRGIDANRLEAEGKGSSEPLDENNLEVNRRTEFIVIE